MVDFIFLSKWLFFSGSTVLQVVKWPGSFAPSQIGAVKAWWPLYVRCHFQKTMTYLCAIQVIFVWLVICSHSSSSTRVQVDHDDTLLGRSSELRIHACDDAEHVFPSCSYLCCRAYQTLYWLVSDPFPLESTLDVNHGLTTIHIGWRGYAAFIIYPVFSELNNSFFPVSNNTIGK